MKKEIYKINLLIAVANCSGASENEKNVSQMKIVKYCKKLINQSGLDSHLQENWIISGHIRFLFENKRVTFSKRESCKNSLEKVKNVLEFHNIPFKHTKGNTDCYERLVLI